MTYQEKRERNEKILLEWNEMQLRGEECIDDKLGAKYNLSATTIWRCRKEAAHRLGLKIHTETTLQKLS